MKKKILFISFILFTFITIITSCEKNNSLPVIDKNSQVEKATDLINPFEYVGVEHNRILKEFTLALERSFINKEWVGIKFLSDEYKNNFSEIIDMSYHKLYPNSESTVSAQKQLFVDINASKLFDNNGSKSLK